MIKTAIFLIALALPAAAQDAVEIPGHPRLATTDALGRHMFEALATGNYEKARSATALRLTRKEIGRLFEDIIERVVKGQAGNPNQGKALQRLREQLAKPERLDEEFKKMSEKAEPKFHQAFNTIRAHAKAEQIDWNNAKYLKTDDSKVRKGNEIPFEEGDLTVHFSANGRQYRLLIEDAANTPLWGWMGGPDPLQLQPLKGEK
jgi:ABC-type phosphate transport system auxiliary subunit